MRATFTPEQEQIEQTLSELGAGGLVAARSCLEEGWSAPQADDQLLADFGALGLGEEFGGFGGTIVDIAVAVEALARTLVPTRLPGQLAAIQVAAAAGIDVEAAATGTERWALAADEPSADGPDAWQAHRDGDRVVGPKTLVAYGADADAFVVCAGEEIVVVEGGEIIARTSVDATRPVVDLVPSGTIRAFGHAPNAFLRATVIVAADLCGAAKGAVALGAAYARDREQFGRPIGSYQGVAFQLADAFVATKAAWDLTLYAAWAVDTGAPEAAACVHAAKAKAGQAALFAAERSMQVHGGIGITLEADPHLFVRRALFGDASLGRGRWHRLALGRRRLAA